MKKIFYTSLCCNFIYSCNAQNCNRDNKQNDQWDNQTGYGKTVGTGNDRYDKDDRRDYGKFSMKEKEIFRLHRSIGNMIKDSESKKQFLWPFWKT